jgi:hypothetical protein
VSPTDPRFHDTALPPRSSILSSYSKIDLIDNPLAVREVRQTGPVTRSTEVRGWCINPSTSFPLTVVGCGKETACEIREALDGLVGHYFEDVTEAVAGLVVERGARFREFENYIETVRQNYRTARTCKVVGTEDDAIDEEVELIDTLDICDEVATLIEGEYPNSAAELTAIRGFGYGNLLRYLGAGPATVKLTPPGHRRRIGFDALVRVDLAIKADRIPEIPTEALLRAMSLKDLRALSSLPIPSKLRKKNLAIEFVQGQRGIRERAMTATDLDAVFYLVPPPRPLSDLDLRGLHDRMSFAWRMANLTVGTYLTAASAPTNREYEGKRLAQSIFRVHNVRDILSCRSCSERHGESRPLAEWSLFPFHFGCRCILLVEAR